MDYGHNKISQHALQKVRIFIILKLDTIKKKKEEEEEEEEVEERERERIILYYTRTKI